jgi:hypothetical protein
VAQIFHEKLPEQYHVFCNLVWSKAAQTRGKKTGEIDFIVAAPANYLHIIELSLGRFELDGKGQLIMKTPEGFRNKSSQLNTNKSIIIEFLQKAKTRNIHIPSQTIEGWLLLPNTSISKETVLLRYPEDHIIDRSSSVNPTEELATKIRAFSTDDRAKEQSVHPGLIKLLSQELEYVPDVSSLASTELSFTSGVNETSELIFGAETNSDIVVVDGVAGSGKTQLALIGLKYWNSSGYPACLVANTRVIPNLLRQQLGDRENVYSFHEFSTLDNKKFQKIFVDEAHHFNANALGSIYSKLSPRGKLYALMDSAQNFDSRFATPPNATIFHFHTSYRIPPKLCDYLSQLKPLNRKIRCGFSGIESIFDIHVGDSSLAACLDIMALFFFGRPELLGHAGIVFCGSKLELQERLSETLEKILEFLRFCGRPSTLEALGTDIKTGCLNIDSQRNIFGLTIDTIRRWQGTSRPIIFVCNLHRQVDILTACRVFYSSVTRSRSRCEVLATPAFAQQLIAATET